MTLQDLDTRLTNTDIYYKARGGGWLKYTGDKIISDPTLPKREIGSITIDFELERALVTLL